MQGERKKVSDCEAFCDVYIYGRKEKTISNEESSFLLGYYTHLLTDAAFQAMIQDENRIRAIWKRIKANEQLRQESFGMDETWDSVRRLISKSNRMKEIYTMEAEYLRDHPSSGYLTEILPLKDFPDYIDYLPHGSVVRKIGVMRYLPTLDGTVDFITMSRREYVEFVDQTVRLVLDRISKIRI